MVALAASPHLYNKPSVQSLTMNTKPFLLFAAAIFFYSSISLAQTVKLPDGRATETCRNCRTLIEQMPKEVMFGIHIQENGDILFTISNKDYFNKFIAGPEDGITVDIVPKTRYSCNTVLSNDAIRGVMLKPVYQAELKKNMQDMGGGSIAIRIGAIPANMKGKEIEGNLVLINKGKICYNTSFLDIPRSRWELLPMGLYADTLMKEVEWFDEELTTIPYVHQMDFTIPFSKNSATYNEADLKPILDTISKYKLHVTRMHIRAYSSVEGSVTANASIQQLRAASVIKALQQKQTGKINSSVTALENWMEFYRDITNTGFNKMKQVSRQDVKRQLMDASILAQLEPILQKHRKAVVTLYLDKNSGQEKADGSHFETKFRNAIREKKINDALAIQREVFNRIADNRLPSTYLGKLEIPREKIFSGLLNNQATYNYFLMNETEEDPLETFKSIVELDPSNEKARYNLCALTLTYIAEDTLGMKPDSLARQIQLLAKYKIPASLITRMMLNLNIILSDYYLSRYDYVKKDKAAYDAVQHYFNLKLKDEELLSVAKFLAHYSLMEMAEKILKPRIGQIDVSEDLVFYYLNLKLFHASEYETEAFQTIMNNAITLNSRRFCRLFRSQEKGGIGFQLLEHPELLSVWCEQCSKLQDLDLDDVRTGSSL